MRISNGGYVCHPFLPLKFCLCNDGSRYELSLSKSLPRMIEVSLTLRERAEKVAVSRSYAHLFGHMWPPARPRRTRLARGC